MTFGQKLQKLREESGLSQDNIASMLFVTTQSVIEWESNNTMPSANQLINLSHIFGISVDELLGNNYMRPIAKTEIVTDKKEIKKIFKFKFLNSISVFVSAITLIIIMCFTSFCLSISGNMPAMSINNIIIILFYITFVLAPAIILSIIKYSTRSKVYNQPDGSLLFFNTFILIQHTDGTTYNIPYSAVKKIYELDYYFVMTLANHRTICIKKENAEGYIDYATNIFRHYNILINCTATRTSKKSNFTQSSLFTLKSLVTGLTVIAIGSIYLSLIIWAFGKIIPNSSEIMNTILNYLPILIPLCTLIFGIVVFCKKVKSKRLIIASSIILFLTIIYASLFTMMPTFQNSSMGTQDFEAEMKKQEFLVDDITTQRTENYLEKCYVATYRTGEYEIYCLEFDSYSSYGNTSALDFYNKTKNEYKTGDHLYTSSEQKKYSNQQYFIGQSFNEYYFVYLDNTTVIYACADIEHKEKIQKSLSNYINFH